MIKRVWLTAAALLLCSGSVLARPNACVQTEARLVANLKSARYLSFYFRYLPPNAKLGLPPLTCSANPERAIVTDVICFPAPHQPVGTVLVCGHPGGDCSVVACCASDDGCFVYRPVS